MGLDVYAIGTDGRPVSEEAFRDIPPLAGGWFSQGGCGPYFRGTPYAAYVLSVTGVSLYQEYIPPETVRKMAFKLEAARRAAEGHAAVSYRGPDGEAAEMPIGEARAVAEWFAVCARNGFAVACEF